MSAQTQGAPQVSKTSFHRSSRTLEKNLCKEAVGPSVPHVRKLDAPRLREGRFNSILWALGPAPKWEESSYLEGPLGREPCLEPPLLVIHRAATNTEAQAPSRTKVWSSMSGRRLQVPSQSKIQSPRSLESGPLPQNHSNSCNLNIIKVKKKKKDFTDSIVGCYNLISLDLNWILKYSNNFNVEPVPLVKTVSPLVVGSASPLT